VLGLSYYNFPFLAKNYLEKQYLYIFQTAIRTQNFGTLHLVGRTPITKPAKATILLSLRIRILKAYYSEDLQ
jgi:hypothetical protein